MNTERGAMAVASLWVLCVITLSGCVTTHFSQPIASFQESVNTSSLAIGAYLSGLNEFERSVYFDDLASDGSQPLLAVDAQGNRTPLLGHYFSGASIRARMDALTLLGIYANRLTELAGSDPGTRFQTSASALGSSLVHLDETFAHLGTQAGDEAPADPRAARYVGPISALVGSIGKMYLESTRDKAIAEAVNSAAPQVNEILSLLESDLTDVVAPLERTGLKIELGTAVQDYNRRRAGLTPEARRALLASVQDRATAYEAVVNANPGTLIIAIRTSNNALIQYANSPKDPRNFNEFMDSLRMLAQRAQEVSSQIQQIRNIHGK